MGWSRKELVFMLAFCGLIEPSSGSQFMELMPQDTCLTTLVSSSPASSLNECAPRCLGIRNVCYGFSYEEASKNCSISDSAETTSCSSAGTKTYIASMRPPPTTTTTTTPEPTTTTTEPTTTTTIPTTTTEAAIPTTTAAEETTTVGLTLMSSAAVLNANSPVHDIDGSGTTLTATAIFNGDKTDAGACFYADTDTFFYFTLNGPSTVISEIVLYGRYGASDQDAGDEMSDIDIYTGSNVASMTRTTNICVSRSGPSLTPQREVIACSVSNAIKIGIRKPNGGPLCLSELEVYG